LISAIEPNEDESYEQLNERVVSGRVYSNDDVKKARFAEFERLDEYQAKEDVSRESIDGPLLSVVWVDESRAEGLKSRICARPFNMPKKHPDMLYTPTPGAATLRTLLCLAASRSWEVRFFDISRAFLHTPIREKVFLVPPPEYREYCQATFGHDPGGVVWKLRCTIYGLNEAMVDFDKHYASVSVDTLKMTRVIAEPSVYVRSGPVIVTKHVDDGMVIGKLDEVNGFLREMGEHFLLKVSPVLPPGGQQVHLGRVIERLADNSGYSIRCAEKTVDSLLDILGLGRRNLSVHL
jgi:hypothetical protein